ncbi:MAG: hypothetical protein AVDCRST_MAG59-2600, partial [uncultured Thermomicrobiales bacterium]
WPRPRAVHHMVGCDSLPSKSEAAETTRSGAAWRSASRAGHWLSSAIRVHTLRCFGAVPGRLPRSRWRGTRAEREKGRGELAAPASAEGAIDACLRDPGQETLAAL